MLFMKEGEHNEVKGEEMLLLLLLALLDKSLTYRLFTYYRLQILACYCLELYY